jgi:hypothetical protein
MVIEHPAPPIRLFAWIISTFRFWQFYSEYLIFDLATKSSIELFLQRRALVKDIGYFMAVNLGFGDRLFSAEAFASA